VQSALALIGVPGENGSRRTKRPAQSWRALLTLRANGGSVENRTGENAVRVISTTRSRRRRHGISLGDMTTLDVTHELIALVQRAHTLGTIGDLLGWDEQVNLPPGGAEQRANQQAILATVHHAAACEPRIGEVPQGA